MSSPSEGVRRGPEDLVSSWRGHARAGMWQAEAAMIRPSSQTAVRQQEEASVALKGSPPTSSRRGGRTPGTMRSSWAWS